MIVAGVDGRPGGWLAASRRADGTGPVAARVAAAFGDLADDAALIAVDMPVGLPERVTGGGRGPEQAIRPLLGARRSSVFAIPGRAAVYAVEPHPAGLAAPIEAHRGASAVALALSDPPRRSRSRASTCSRGSASSTAGSAPIPRGRRACARSVPRPPSGA